MTNKDLREDIIKELNNIQDKQFLQKISEVKKKYCQLNWDGIYVVLENETKTTFYLSEFLKIALWLQFDPNLLDEVDRKKMEQRKYLFENISASYFNSLEDFFSKHYDIWGNNLFSNIDEFTYLLKNYTDSSFVFNWKDVDKKYKKWENIKDFYWIDVDIDITEDITERTFVFNVINSILYWFLSNVSFFQIYMLYSLAIIYTENEGITDEKAMELVEEDLKSFLSDEK